MEAIWSLPFMLSIVQKLLIKLCLKTTPKISTKAATLHVSRENRGGENTRKARSRKRSPIPCPPAPWEGFFPCVPSQCWTPTISLISVNRPSVNRTYGQLQMGWAASLVQKNRVVKRGLGDSKILMRSLYLRIWKSSGKEERGTSCPLAERANTKDAPLLTSQWKLDIEVKRR